MRKFFLMFALALGFMLPCLGEEVPAVYVCGDYQYILLEDGTAEIVNYSGSAKQLTVPETLDERRVSSVGNYAFASSSLTGIILPDSIMNTGINPFAKCVNLKRIQVSPDHPVLAVIDGVLFSKTEKTLICYPAGKTETEYTVPKGITEIGDFAFFCCSDLTSITLPEGVIEIGDWAFNGCSDLMNIILPETLIIIRADAFRCCESLTSITLPDSVTIIESNPFTLCNDLKRIWVSPDNPSFASIDGVLFSKTEKTLICYPAGKTETEYAVPQGITEIGDFAFDHHSLLSEKSLKNITLPEGIVRIGNHAFSGCYTSSITLPDSLTIIGDYAFSGCSGLTSIILPERLVSIGDCAFGFCRKLTSITLPDSLVSIGDDPFNSSDNLTSIVVSRDSYAAQYCKQHGLPYTYPGSNDWLNN